MGSLKSIRLDNTSSTEGVMFDYMDGIKLKIARWMNPAHKKAIRSYTRALQKGGRARSPSNDQLEEITLRATSTHILLGWENLDNDDGSPLEYTPETSLELLSDPELSDMLAFVTECSMAQEAFLKVAREESLEN